MLLFSVRQRLGYGPPEAPAVSPARRRRRWRWQLGHQSRLRHGRRRRGQGAEAARAAARGHVVPLRGTCSAGAPAARRLRRRCKTQTRSRARSSSPICSVFLKTPPSNLEETKKRLASHSACHWFSSSRLPSGPFLTFCRQSLRFERARRVEKSRAHPRWQRQVSSDSEEPGGRQPMSTCPLVVFWTTVPPLPYCVYVD